MSMQKIMGWGHDFLRITAREGVVFKPLVQWGKAKCQRENPSKLSTTFLVLFNQSFITAINWLSWLLHGMGKLWQPKFELGRAPIFEKRVLTPWASKNPKTSAHSNMLSHFHVFLTIFLHVGLLKEVGTSYVGTHSRFWLLPHFP